MTRLAWARVLLAAGFAGFAIQGAVAAEESGVPSLEEMIEALSAKPPPLTRGFRPGAAPAAPAKPGRLELSIPFEFASARITPPGREVLGRLAEAMKSPALAGRVFRIEGHTDAVGSPESNQRLSERRANAVLEFVRAASGVPPSRLGAVGLGSTQLADPAHPASGANRRVVILSMAPGAGAPPAAQAAPPAPAQARPGARPKLGMQGREGAGTVERVVGELRVRRGPSSSVLLPGARVREGDVLVTAKETSALVRLDDGANLLLRASSMLRVTTLRLAGEASAWRQAFHLLVGAYRFVTGSLGASKPEAVTLTTDMATIGIRGTDLDVVYKREADDLGDGGTYVRVNRGQVDLGGFDGSRVELGRSEQAFASSRPRRTRGGAPLPAAMRLEGPVAVFAADELDRSLESR